MKVFIGSDHGGFSLKSALIEELQSMNIDYKDCGCFSAESVDYPDIAQETCKKVLEEKSMGILICGTGIGISIAANKIPGIRAALCHNSTTARLTRQHNNANVLCIGERVTGLEVAKDTLRAFLENDFEGGRHERRVNKIETC